MGRNLPWEESGYFCLFNEELVKYDESYIGRVFEEAGLHIRYDSAEGRYLVTRPDRRVAGAVKLVVFSKEGQLQEVIEPTYYRYKPSYILKLDNAHLVRISVVTNIRIRIRIRIFYSESRIFGFGFVIFAGRIIFGFGFVIES